MCKHVCLSLCGLGYIDCSVCSVHVRGSCNTTAIVTSSYELPRKRAGNWKLILCKCRVFPQPLSISPASLWNHFNAFINFKTVTCHSFTDIQTAGAAITIIIIKGDIYNDHILSCHCFPLTMICTFADLHRAILSHCFWSFITEEILGFVECQEYPWSQSWYQQHTPH